MSDIAIARTTDGIDIEYIDHIIASGGMKDVYFTPDKKNVVAFFREDQGRQSLERLEMITDRYRKNIFDRDGGNYWEPFLRWPTKILISNDNKLGILVPAYQDYFFFSHGSVNEDFLNIKGREKEGKWFASPTNRNKYLKKTERGDWSSYLKISISISRTIRRLHAAGLAHSDLSYKNVLIDPVKGNACIIDIDGLVVPGKYPPDVVGTPDFIAPEVIQTTHLSRYDPSRKLPSIYTDRHALAVLIYMYLLLRHPLRGDKVHDIEDPQRDEELSMGEKALFVEHPTDNSNRIKKEYVKSSDLPWKDTAALPYHITGPYLSRLFEQAFIDGLQHPEKRPTADEWEQALIKTVDLIQPCQNPDCEQKWYVFDNTKKPVCPFCKTDYKGKLPILNLYSCHIEGKYMSDNHRLMVYTEQSLFKWHINKKIIPNERLSMEDKKRVGYFIFHKRNWLLVNENIPDLYDNMNKKQVPIGETVLIEEKTQLLFSKEEGGRLALVQMVDVQ